MATDSPHDKRAAPRAAFESYLQLAVEDVDSFVHGFAKDLSRTGMSIKVGERMTIDTFIALRAVDKQNRTVFEVTARVVWCDFDGPPYRVGLRFVTLSDEAEKVIADLAPKPAPTAPAAPPEPEAQLESLPAAPQTKLAATQVTTLSAEELEALWHAQRLSEE